MLKKNKPTYIFSFQADKVNRYNYSTCRKSDIKPSANRLNKTSSTFILDTAGIPIDRIYAFDFNFLFYDKLDANTNIFHLKIFKSSIAHDLTHFF
jgi:hypothetical protein